MKYKIKKNSVIVSENGKQIAELILQKTEIYDYSVYVIESVDVSLEHQRKGIYTNMLLKYADKHFQGNNYFASVCRSEDAANFWSKKLNLDVETTLDNDNCLLITSDLKFEGLLDQ